MKDLLELQKKLQEKIQITKGWSILNCKTNEDRERWTKEFVVAIMAELGEVLDWISWKPWKKRIEITPAKIKELKIELIDIQHFLNNLYLIWDMDAEEIKKLYLEKHNENKRRQESNY